jgi:hypothetical protein
MRPISQDMYGIPHERVIGSASPLEYVGDDGGGTITHTPEADYLDDGPQKPLHDDADREFDDTGGAEQALQQSDTDGWTVVSIKNDWATVFPIYNPRLARAPAPPSLRPSAPWTRGPAARTKPRA